MWTGYNNLELKWNVIPWKAKNCFWVWIFSKCEFTDSSLVDSLKMQELWIWLNFWCQSVNFCNNVRFSGGQFLREINFNFSLQCYITLPFDFWTIKQSTPIVELFSSPLIHMKNFQFTAMKPLPCTEAKIWANWTLTFTLCQKRLSLKWKGMS